MRDILITGGAGKIGYNLVLKLLESDYSITVLDLESKKSVNELNTFKNKLKFVYGDVEDANLVRELVKRNDIVVDYAGVMPPLANLNEKFSNGTNYLGTKNIVDSIKEVNPECVYIYMSFVSVYGPTDNVKREITEDTLSNDPDDFYSVCLIRSEEYIRSNLKKYAIFRMPIVLTSKNYYINHLSLDRSVEFLTKSDVNDMIIPILKSKKIYGKTINLYGNRVKSERLVEGIFKATGELALINRNLYYGVFDNKNSSDIIDVKNTDLKVALEEMYNETPKAKRVFRKIINYPKYWVFKIKVKVKK